MRNIFAHLLIARNQPRETFGDSIELTHLLAAGRTKVILEMSHDEQAPRITTYMQA